MSRTAPILPHIFTLSCAVVCLAAGACNGAAPLDSETAGPSEGAGDGPTCGDGIVEGDETCDDGNADSDDGCSELCQLETCGDGVVQASQACDDGNDVPTGGAAECGDGVADAGEGCDDGNTEAGDGCSSTCQLESCGDGLVQAGEACDEGTDTPTCDADCTHPTCGDSYANAQAGEACDDGNLIDTDRCTDQCTRIPPCGDGVVDDGQQCDDGPGSAACDADCTAASCGDGFTNALAGEACDDGNAVNDDTCSNDCTIPVCVGDMACGAHLWSKRFGDGGEQRASGVAVDAAGNVVFTGAFEESMNMGGETLLSAGGTDIFLAKFSPAGDFMWSKRFGDGMEQLSRAISVDSQGNIAITGEFHGTMNLGGGDLVSQGQADLFLAEFSPAGEHLWSRRFGDGDFQIGRAVAVDGQDNVIVTGNLWGTADLGGGELVNQGSDLFVAKFSPAGEHLWSQHHGDGEPQTGKAVAVDDQDNIVVAGNFNGTMDLGGGLLASADWADIFVAKLSPSGDHLWSRRFGGDDHQYASAVAVDGQNNVALTGDYYGTLNFGGGDFISAGHKDLYVAKFTPSGEHLWSKSSGDSEDQFMYGAAIDGAGDLVLTGMFAGAIDLGGGAITSQGALDLFVAKLSGAGDQVWVRRAGDWNHQGGNAVAVDGQGDVVIAGTFASVINLGGEDLVTEGIFDLYLAKLGG